MSSLRARVTAMAASAALLVSLGLGAPASAADSPEAAVNEFLDLVVAGDFSAIENVVCAEDQAAMIEAWEQYARENDVFDHEGMFDALYRKAYGK